MARSIFDAPTRQHVIDRINRLRPDSPRKFGKMEPNEMMCHMEDAILCANGRRPTRVRKSFMSNPFVRWLILYVIPWPKGKAETVAEMKVTRPTDFETDRARLIALVNETSARGPSAAWAVHPAFGDMSGREYGVLIYRHFDHHLKQFGV